MSCLRKFLVYQTAGYEKKSKTPAIISHTVPVNPLLTTAIISLPDGSFRAVRNAQTGQVRTGCFPVDQEEDTYHAALVEAIWSAALEKEWGNVAVIPKLGRAEAAAAEGYFADMGLEMAHVFVGYKAYRSLLAQGMLQNTALKPLSEKEVKTPEELLVQQRHEICVAVWAKRPVHYNPHLGDRCVFALVPEVTGVFLRLEKHATVLCHNPELSVVVYLIDEAQDVPGHDSTSRTEGSEASQSDGVSGE